MNIIIFFTLGLLIGSFLNVLVYRLNVAESFATGRSHCPHCKKTIAWYDNIPLISFILLKFRCRSCKEKISWQYPLVELGTGIIFALIGWKFFALTDSTTWFRAFYYLATSGALVTILVYDFLYLEIPSLVLWPAIGFSIVCNLILDWAEATSIMSPLGTSTYLGIVAAFSAFIFFFLLSSLSREKWMGMGDAFLVILLGLILGWPQILLGLFLAFATGSIYGIMLVALKKKSMKSQVPFAPFLVVGTIITLLFYNQIINWYLGLFGF